MSTYSGKILKFSPDIHIEPAPAGTVGQLYRAKMIAWHTGEYVLASDYDALQSQVDALRKRLREVLDAPHSNTSDKDPTGVMVLLDAYWLAAVASETSHATGGQHE